MPRIPSALLRPKAAALVALGSGALGGYGYLNSFSDDASSTSLDPYTFAPYTLTSREPVSSTSSIFTLRSRNGHGNNDDPAATRRLKDVWTRAVWSVEVKQPQLQIARAYTPLPSNSTDSSAEDGSELRLLIRKEHKGEVSNYLHRLPEQSTIELRGPHVEFEIPAEVREVLFIAGGTGIAPAMQVARVLGERRGARMHVLWANRLREDCVGGRGEGMGEQSGSWVDGLKSVVGLKGEREKDLVVITGQSNAENEQGAIVKELEMLKKRSKANSEFGLSVDYYVDEEGTFIRPADVSRQVQLSGPREANDKPGSKLIMVSGPDGFLEYWAGRKVWAAEGEVQGPLRGALSRVDLKGWRVWKL
ncbi:hypothetical protein K490DRAFT_75911 [Saccharata proteae CBS 121410]|uniref:FAD-binding FR-type domain-containing protein n=1 Tax=Saccharata proteae CBS 121410 TaxID=1314787 RepID=A0A9P4LUQ4_9PEZI|nr:hypothetical protein K490DRAFT_75911 [Saccharata proteae CBS 121410]